MTVKHINNHIEGLTTETVTDIVQYCDEHTDTDREFYEAFTLAIFDRFNWSYSSKNTVSISDINKQIAKEMNEEAQDKVDQRSFEDYPRIKGSRDGYWESKE